MLSLVIVACSFKSIAFVDSCNQRNNEQKNFPQPLTHPKNGTTKALVSCPCPASFFVDLFTQGNVGANSVLMRVSS